MYRFRIGSERKGRTEKVVKVGKVGKVEKVVKVGKFSFYAMVDREIFTYLKNKK